jgi:Protein of unknown function (DUF2510)
MLALRSAPRNFQGVRVNLCHNPRNDRQPRGKKNVTTQPPAPSWYPDPSSKPGLMYWDGRGWHTNIPAPVTPAAAPTRTALTLGTPLLSACRAIRSSQIHQTESRPR